MSSFSYFSLISLSSNHVNPLPFYFVGGGSECEGAHLSPDLHCCTALSSFRTPSSITAYAFHHSIVSAAFCQYSNAFNRIIASIGFLNKLLLSVQWKKDLKHKHAAHLLLLHWYQILLKEYIYIYLYLWLLTLEKTNKKKVSHIRMLNFHMNYCEFIRVYLFWLALIFKVDLSTHRRRQDFV